MYTSKILCLCVFMIPLPMPSHNDYLADRSHHFHFSLHRHGSAISAHFLLLCRRRNFWSPLYLLAKHTHKSLPKDRVAPRIGTLSLDRDSHCLWLSDRQIEDLPVRGLMLAMTASTKRLVSSLVRALLRCLICC